MAEGEKRIAVFTSGGDAPGMNAAIRAIVRRCCILKVEVYAIMEGYSGMIKGSNYIKRMGWRDVSGLLSLGGTIIGTSRCPEFQTKEGRIKAAKNLLDFGINKLICIGGDGSLKGAHILSEEWPEIVECLYSENKISKETKDKCRTLTIAGIVGSIDNDFWGTDLTIGATTALHRITEAVDCILTTALSHHRTFIIEVMGRNCGFLALMSAMAVAADYVFIAEKPTEENWKEKLCRVIKRARDLNRLYSIIIVSEGAIDIEGKRITVNEVKQVLSENLGFDSRITLLGHVQRGGSPCAFDRLLSTLFGVKAVDHLVSSEENVVVCFSQSKILLQPLLKCVENTNLITEKIESKRFDEALNLRPERFRLSLETYKNFVRSKMAYCGKEDTAPVVAIINIGKSAPGMNSAVKALTRLLLGCNYCVYGVESGIKGLVEGNLKKLNWNDVDNWINVGGSLLGTNKKQPDNYLSEISEVFQKYRIQGLFIVGGWEGYTAALSLSNNAHKYPTFNVPIICIPATIANNCPGTDTSLGADTALNMIIMSCDILKQYTNTSKNRVFIIEVQGGKCGYLATAALITGGCHICYTPEKGITLQKLLNDVNMLKNRYKQTDRMALIVYGENSNKTYTTSEVMKILNEEGEGIYSVKNLVLGDIQQGHVPSPTDRILGLDFANKAFEVFHKAFKDKSTIVCGIGLDKRGYKYTELKDLISNMDFENKRPFSQEWEKTLTDIYGTLS